MHRLSNLKRGEVQLHSYPYSILATFNTIFTLHVLYYYLIMNFGNLGGLETIVWYVYSASNPFHLVFIHIHVIRSFKVIHIIYYSVFYR